MAGGNRIYHLDAVRCFCMLYGLLLHGGTIGNTWLFVLIQDVSDHFRMAGFFLVSGYFATMVYTRTRIGRFFAERGRMLLVPMVVGMLLLNPPTMALIKMFHWGPDRMFEQAPHVWRAPIGPPPLIGEFYTLHLWFLLTLFIYTLMVPALLRLVPGGLAERLKVPAARIPPVLRLALLTILIGGLALVLRAASDQLVLPALPLRLHFVAQRTLYYFPFFLAGLLAFRFSGIYETIHRFPAVGLLIVGAAYLAFEHWSGGLPPVLERASYWMLRASFTFLLVCTLMAVMRRFVTKGSPWLTRMTGRVYSFYIFHYLVIYIIANLMHQLTDNLYVIFAAIVIAGYPILFALHDKLIARSPLLLFLFNGKPYKPRPVAAA